jgi:hypothetical protein
MWEEYRFGSIWGVLMSVNAAIGAPRTERGDSMLTAMVERHAHHVIDLDALSLLV